MKNPEIPQQNDREGFLTQLYSRFKEQVTPENFERVKTINFLDGNPEFHTDRPILEKGY